MGKALFAINFSLAVVNALAGSLGLALLCAVGALMSAYIE